MLNSKISIILTTYNSEKFIINTLSKIINQSSMNFELIIVDDFSADNTFEIIKATLKKGIEYLLVRNDSNKGVSASREIGLNKSNYNYVTFLDHDDFLCLNFVEYFNFLTTKYSDVELYNLDYKGIQSNLEYEDSETNDFNQITTSSYTLTPDKIQYPSHIWSKIYKREIFDDETINNLKKCSKLLFLEDLSLPFYFMGKNLRVLSSSKISYYHLRHNDNQSRIDLYGKYFIDQINIGTELLKLFNEYNLTEIYNRYVVDYTSLLIGIYSRHKMSKSFTKPELSVIHHLIINYSSYIRRTAIIFNVRNLIISVIGFQPDFFSPFINYYNKHLLRRY
jgi:glycosyltransferase involved in cell wall biosynthesis